MSILSTSKKGSFSRGLMVAGAVVFEAYCGLGTEHERWISSLSYPYHSIQRQGAGAGVLSILNMCPQHNFPDFL